MYIDFSWTLNLKIVENIKKIKILFFIYNYLIDKELFYLGISIPLDLYFLFLLKC